MCTYTCSTCICIHVHFEYSSEKWGGGRGRLATYIKMYPWAFARAVTVILHLVHDCCFLFEFFKHSSHETWLYSRCRVGEAADHRSFGSCKKIERFNFHLINARKRHQHEISVEPVHVHLLQVPVDRRHYDGWTVLACFMHVSNLSISVFQTLAGQYWMGVATKLLSFLQIGTNTTHSAPSSTSTPTVHLHWVSNAQTHAPVRRRHHVMRWRHGSKIKRRSCDAGRCDAACDCLSVCA